MEGIKREKKNEWVRGEGQKKKHTDRAHETLLDFFSACVLCWYHAV